MGTARTKFASPDPKGRTPVYRFPRENPYRERTLEHKIHEELIGGMIPKDELVRIDNGIATISDLFLALRVVANPLHPRNRWSSAVESVIHNGKEFLRIVFDVPLTVKEYWEQNGHPPSMETRFLDFAENIEAGVPNPYKEGTDRHRIFEKAREFRPLDEILADAQASCGKPRRLVQKTWYDLAHPNPEKQRYTRVEERTLPDGRKVVRLVPVES